MSIVDVVIVGAGPAGISAALWAHTLELRYEALDAGGAAGGQLHRVYNKIVDYLGFPSADDGAALATRFREHLDAIGVRTRQSRPAVHLDADAPAVETATERIAAKFVLLATGVRRRTLGVPGEADFVGRGVSPSASRYAERFRGKRVLVIGGGDAAFEEALILAGVCEHVTLAFRGDAPRARGDFRARAAATSVIEMAGHTDLVAIEGSQDVERAVLRREGVEIGIPVAGVFVCVGVIPNSNLMGTALDLDQAGYVRVNARQRTSSPRVYAAGDVCSGSSLTISAAVGQGAAAIKDMQRRIAAES